MLRSTLMALGMLALVSGPALAAEYSKAPPPAPYEKVSKLVKLPDFLPGIGTLYVDPKTLPDPTDPCNLERSSGRGMLLMRTFMDRVEYNGAVGP